MKRYALKRRSATVTVLYPSDIPFDLADLEAKLGHVGVTCSSIAKGNMQGAIMHFPSRDGALSLEAIAGHLSFILEYMEEGEVREAAFQLPFTIFHTVQLNTASVVYDPAVSILPGRNPRLKVALAHEDNMKIYLYGAHAKQIGEIAVITPRHSTFCLHILTGEKRIKVSAVSLTSGEVLETHRFRGPAELHRHISSVLRIAQNNQKAHAA